MGKGQYQYMSPERSSIHKRRTDLVARLGKPLREETAINDYIDGDYKTHPRCVAPGKER
ncbi:hypothetical protein PhaeoP14_03630 (plasmid) [Phaeobacter piscinae]|nr:hypothetical protein PhaeoP14_03630 [Phaeobacter piscinae]